MRDHDPLRFFALVEARTQALGLAAQGASARLGLEDRRAQLLAVLVVDVLGRAVATGAGAAHLDLVGDGLVAVLGKPVRLGWVVGVRPDTAEEDRVGNGATGADLQTEPQLVV
jgi:hypothetical protein